MSSLRAQMTNENTNPNKSVVASQGATTKSIIRPRGELYLKSSENCFLLNSGLNVIGRSPKTSDISIDKPSISLKHCVLLVSKNRIHIRDLASTNGTFVNNRKIRLIDLKIGDQIKFGNISFELANSRGISSSVADTKTTSKLSSIEDLIISNPLESDLANPDLNISENTKTSSRKINSRKNNSRSRKKKPSSGSPVVNNYFITKTKKDEVNQYNSQESTAFLKALDSVIISEKKSEPEILRRIRHDDEEFESNSDSSDDKRHFLWFLFSGAPFNSGKNLFLLVMLLVLIIVNSWLFFFK
jgi:pSer/pThr/pTyr-binding forkhead associated (FHA) protein